MAIRLDITIANAADALRRRRMELTVDPDGNFAVLPEEVWTELGLMVDERIEFVRPDGSLIERGLGHALFTFRGRARISPVILGEDDDLPVIGHVTLAILGYEVDRLGHELRPLPMLLMRARLVLTREPRAMPSSDAGAPSARRAGAAPRGATPAGGPGPSR